MDAFDERVLRDDEPADDGRVVLDADDQPAPLELREQRRAHPSPTASSTALLSAGSVAARIDRDACGARLDARGGVRRVDAADRDHRHVDRGADRRSPSRPIGGSASSFDGVAQTGPAPR